jgi:hypothetical protein
MKINTVIPAEKCYSERSFDYHVYPGTSARRHRRDGIAVRVIEYTLATGDTDEVDAGGTPEEERTYRLLTTITDPEAAPAQELAQLYCQRWEIETAFDEVKTHQRGSGVVLRSKTPDGGSRKSTGTCVCPTPIRSVMYSAAMISGDDPDGLSFTRTLRAARRTPRATRASPLTSSVTPTAAPEPKSSTSYSRSGVPVSIPERSNARCPYITSNILIIGTRPASPAGLSFPQARAYLLRELRARLMWMK